MTPEMERLLERLQSGWQPQNDEIDMRIRQHRLADWVFAVDLLSYPDDTEVGGWARAEKLLGRSPDGWVAYTGEILWIDAGLRWALCEDGFWWLMWEANSP
ncbi:hypothetical protein M2171_002431 [Bradyrhizobium japonicum USDA 38]|uniref:hypothetical protein n=1 Tax=Bradyrhizobium japonicum TaxID=375 RepID=UPI0004085A0F|nr:hypothetical protein [Bradyrhizobium japonicum]MCS3893298.1 hypothetical protein [Bradyrhizobium japonicum USDA 38]MCS3945812.1 hypothetical protein [Bradyrhizobium japonicum]